MFITLRTTKSYKENQLFGRAYKNSLDSTNLEKEAPVLFGPQRNLNEPPMFLWNKDLFYLTHGNFKTKKYVLSVHKIHATPIPEDDLEEILTRWVGKVFKKFIEEARLSIQHWKSLWAKMFYKKKHYIVRSDLKEVYSNLKIIKVIRVKNEQGYRVQDYQLGIESYQIKINLTAPTLVIPGIEELEPYTIIIDPFIGIVYENNKKQRRVMNINELPKFCDATLDRVLKKVKEIIVAARYGFKDSPQNEEHKKVMGFFEEEIKERLMFRRHMRRCESFVNGRPLLSLRGRPE
ncbi:hypothetical protein Tco_1515413 [Tanacetum coccineum]